MPLRGPFDGLRIIAIDLGTMTDGFSVEHYRAHLKECRAGNHDEFICLNMGIREGSVTLDELDLTEEEWDGFRKTALLDPAEQYIKEAAEGNFENLFQLAEWLNKRAISPDELSISLEEIQGLVDEDNRQWVEKILEEFRNGDFENLHFLIRNLGQLDSDKLGIDMEELKGFGRQANLEQAKEIAEQCRAGNFAHLDELQFVIEAGGLDDGQVELLGLDLEGWHQARKLSLSRHLLKTARTGNPMAQAMLKAAVETGEINLDDLDISADEFDRIFQPSTA